MSGKIPLCEEPLAFSLQLCNVWSNICCLSQHGGLRGAKGNMWNHLPEIPPVCIQLYVLGESPFCRRWASAEGLSAFPAALKQWRRFCRLSKHLRLNIWVCRGRRHRSWAVMTSWSVSKHGWWMRKMRRNHFIFKQSKIGLIGWPLLLCWLLESAQSCIFWLKTQRCVQRPSPLNFPVMRTRRSRSDPTTKSWHIWIEA